MLLAIDVGNSNTSVGLFDRDKQLRFLASLDTDRRPDQHRPDEPVRPVSLPV